MDEGGSRRVTLLDLMALVVAIATGLAVLRSFGDFSAVRRGVDISFRTAEGSFVNLGVSVSDSMDRKGAEGFRPPIKGRILYWARQLSFWPGPGLAALSLATLALGARQARGEADRPARGAGAAACLAAALALATAAVRLPYLLLPHPVPGQAYHPRWAEWWLELWFTVPELAGFAVAISWATLALLGRWRVGAAWPDRLGLALGLGWIAMATTDLAATWYHALPS